MANKPLTTSPNMTTADVIAEEAQTAPAALTDSSGGTADGTIAAISGSGDDADINNNFAELATTVNAMRTALIASGILTA